MDRPSLSRRPPLRVLIALPLGLVGMALYVGAVVALADRLDGLGWPVHALYFAVAGVLWVLPAHALMLWAAGMPPGWRRRVREEPR